MGSLAPRGYGVVPVIEGNDPEQVRRIREAVNLILQGKMNCTGDVRFGHGVVSTTVSDVRAGIASVILPMATNDTGAAALTTWSINTRNDGSFVITHVSTSTSDATATYAIFG